MGSLERGGIQAFLMSVYANIDKTKIQFDFVINGEPSINSYKEEIICNGGKIYSVTEKKNSFFKNQKEIFDIVKKNKYEIVWRHTTCLFRGVDVIPSRLAGADRVILHSHCSYTPLGEMILGKILAPAIFVCTTDCFACSELAAKNVFGDKNYKFVPNVVDLKRYSFSDEVRLTYREKLNLKSKHVYGHVGRFSKVKNHIFIIDVFDNIAKKDDDAAMILIGDGELREDIESYIVEKGLVDKIQILGNRDDVENLLMAMDVLIFPSLYEGLPVTLIEAQASDLKCIVSDTITKECDILGNLNYLSLEVGTKEWADVAMDLMEQSSEDRISREEDLARAGFSAKKMADEIEGW